MANYQNNMRYGRPMNPNNSRRNMPGNMNDGCCNTPGSASGGCHNMPGHMNEECRSMPSGSNRMADNRRPAPMPREDVRRRSPETGGCHTPEPCNHDCDQRTRKPMEARSAMEGRNCMESRNSMGNRRAMEERPCECEKPKHKACGCRYDALEDFALAMAYVPWQRWQNLFEPCKALECGTIFEDLSKPFYGKGGCNR